MEHKVKFSIPERSLGKADVEFKVHGDGSRIGALRVSRGALVWYPAGNSYGHKVGWKDFGRFMAGQPKAEKR